MPPKGTGAGARGNAKAINQKKRKAESLLPESDVDSASEEEGRATATTTRRRTYSNDFGSDVEGDSRHRDGDVRPTATQGMGTASSSVVSSKSSSSTSHASGGPVPISGGAGGGGFAPSISREYNAAMRQDMHQNMRRTIDAPAGDIAPIMFSVVAGAPDALRHQGRDAAASIAAEWTVTAWRRLQVAGGSGDEPFMSSALSFEDRNSMSNKAYIMQHATLVAQRITQVFYI